MVYRESELTAIAHYSITYKSIDLPYIYDPF